MSSSSLAMSILSLSLFQQSFVQAPDFRITYYKVYLQGEWMLYPFPLQPFPPSMNNPWQVSIKFAMSSCMSSYLVIYSYLRFFSMQCCHFLLFQIRIFSSFEVLERESSFAMTYNCFFLLLRLMSQWQWLGIFGSFCQLTISCNSCEMLELRSIISSFKCFFWTSSDIKVLRFSMMSLVLDRLFLTSSILQTSCLGRMLRMSLWRMVCQQGSVYWVDICWRKFFSSMREMVGDYCAIFAKDLYYS